MSSDNAASFSGLQEGALVLADISGYSKFIAQTEVDHSWSILHELLDTMVRSLSGRMDVSQVEGDAILFISGLSTPEVITAVEGTFVAFHRRLRDMQAVTTCPCSACANIGTLKLKFVVHHGKFSRQRLGSVEQLHGTDVIVAHRLLKNSVPSKEYLLVTDAVLERLPAERREQFTPHSESFDLGAISGGYQEIAYLWVEAQARDRHRVMPDEAFVNSAVTVDAPIALVDSLMLEPEVMQRYLFADDVIIVPGARGTDTGEEFHCHHGGSLVTLRLVSSEPGKELTLYSDQPTDMYVTTRITDEGGGHTCVQRSFLWDEPVDADVAEGLRQMMGAMAIAGEAAIREVFEERARAARPA
ncbi:MAG TPA: DUF2652 domain-containing protein [Candidatus Dormibacteraeota bacterium]|nr:DUF2652 domain-containing protein [Candidatus Dormibacteraeota bacterium]